MYSGLSGFEWLLTQCNRLYSSWSFRDCKAAKKPCEPQRENFQHHFQSTGIWLW